MSIATLKRSSALSSMLSAWSACELAPLSSECLYGWKGGWSVMPNDC